MSANPPAIETITANITNLSISIPAISIPIQAIGIPAQQVSTAATGEGSATLTLDLNALATGLAPFLVALGFTKT
jgi:hypothetical protein